MKTNLHPRFSRLAAISLLLLGLGTAATRSHAATYITADFSATAATPLNNNTGPIFSGTDQYGDPNSAAGDPDPTRIGVSVGRLFSTGTVFSPTAGTYTGTPFYGGGMVTVNQAVTNEGFHELQIGQSNGLMWQTDAAGSESHTSHLLVYFDSAQFNGGSPLSSLSSLTTFSLGTKQVSNPSNSLDVHWVVRNGSTFYVSGLDHILTQNNTITDSLSSLNTAGWASWNPSGSLAALDFVDGGYQPLSFYGLGGGFNNVTGLGFYMENETLTNSTSHVDVSAFVVDVPEPSRFLLTGFGALLLFLRRRRA